MHQKKKKSRVRISHLDAYIWTRMKGRRNFTCHTSVWALGDQINWTYRLLASLCVPKILYVETLLPDMMALGEGLWEVSGIA